MKSFPKGMEQSFEKHMRQRRCSWSICKAGGKVGWTVHISIKQMWNDEEKTYSASGVASKIKDATRSAMQSALLLDIQDPCRTTLPYQDLWKQVEKPLCAFQRPPVSWFETPEILGIDFEGSPPIIVQIASKYGVYIDRIDSEEANRIMSDEKHKHCLFGAHEEKFVKNPINLQKDPKESLVELISKTFVPHIRFEKDKVFVSTTNWHTITSHDTKALEYAALDAEMTRLLGERDNKKPSE